MCLMNCTVPERLNLNWYHKAIWRAVFRQQVWALGRCSQQALELLAEGKETRHIDGKDYVLEYPIKADFALIKAYKGDRWGNLVYRKSARNFGPIMAMADVTIAQVSEVVELGGLDPEHHYPRYFCTARCTSTARTVSNKEK